MQTNLYSKSIATIGTVRTSIASTKELNDIYKLRYEAYLSEDAILPDEKAFFLDKYDSSSNSINHTAYMNNDLIGSIRGCYYDPSNPNKNIPAFEIFKSEIEREIGLDSKIFESCRFVVKPSARRLFHINLALIKTNCIFSYAFNCKHTLTAVRENHVGFYEKMGFKRSSKSKTYPGLKVQMVLLIAKNSQKLMDNFDKSLKRLRHNEIDRKNYIECLRNM